MSTLRNEVIHTALTLGIARIPVLHGAVFHFGSVENDDFNNGCVELILVAHGRRAAFEVGDVAIVVSHDEGTLKLSRACGIDAEVGGEFHGAADALGDIDK